jgi:hypothetical protein
VRTEEVIIPGAEGDGERAQELLAGHASRGGTGAGLFK